MDEFVRVALAVAAKDLRLELRTRATILSAVVFAALVLVANAAGISNNLTILAASLYFWSRIVHLLAYTMALPWVRTVGFTGGFIAQAIFAWQILAH